MWLLLDVVNGDLASTKFRVKRLCHRAHRGKDESTEYLFESLSVSSDNLQSIHFSVSSVISVANLWSRYLKKIAGSDANPRFVYSGTKKWERFVRRSHLNVSSAIAYQCGEIAGIRQRHHQFCVRMIELLFMILYHTKAETKSQARGKEKYLPQRKRWEHREHIE